MEYRILLVDDHAFLRRGVESIVNRHSLGIVCGEAEDGEEAVCKARELKPDVIVMDISMPNMNGIEATRQIRTFDPRVKVIILTMHDSKQIAQVAKEAGADALIQKSQAEAQLVRAARELLPAVSVSDG